MYNETHNPCTREIVKPDFKRPGRRVSEEKCLDYIWQIKFREDSKIKNAECTKYRREYLNIHEYPIIGGRTTVPGEFPHMVALGWKAVKGDYIFKCGGSLISPKFVVTAAHCSRSAKDPKVSNQVPEIIRLGAKNLAKMLVNGESAFYPRDIKIVKITNHPNYKSPKQYSDIALVEMEKEVGFDTNVQPACLWRVRDIGNLGAAVSASGWGVTEVGGKTTTTELQVGDLDVIDDNYCDQLLRPKCNRYWCGLQEHQMCAGKLAGDVDACQGDSGGPLQSRINLDPRLKGKMYYLLGVTSVGFGCARQNTPGIYSRISSFLDWIEPIVWPNGAYGNSGRQTKQEIREFNLPDAVRNEVNEEASNRQAADNQDPLQGRPPCNTTTATKNPCTRNIAVPNFRKPGRRLSEIKCLEYIWDIKNEEEGRTKEEYCGKETTTELRAGDLDIISNNECDPLLRPMCNRLWCGLQEHQMCAGKLDGSVDACQGDSGGPLQAKINLHSSINGRMYYLLGVTSFGFGCARANTPGVFTRISSFVDWIEPIADSNQQPLNSAPQYNNTSICSKNFVKPIFKKPGRRISEEKCLEFIWELKMREEEKKREEAACEEPDFVYEIIRGRLAEPGEFPHMGALGWKTIEGGWIFKCGATLISEKFMVTAGHCTKSIRDRKISKQVPEIVRIGARNLNFQTEERTPYPKDVKIKRIIRHPKYQPPQKSFDIALIELSYWLYFDENVQPACLWTITDVNKLDKKLSASGWGATEIGEKKTTAELRVGELDLVDKDVCNQLLNKMCSRLWCGLEDHQMCAGKLDEGDSGGPLQAPISLPPSIQGKMYYLVGVTSFGFGCARANSPGVYTRVSSFVDWIEPIVWPNATNSE
ncbi:transmembrane protease serine 9-like [Aricia agestis]|uniref:transmembrane protease serine 9-like n=1 Tax=Aricia agestis TaxID=91739 RepID=UPI001C20A15F|nr:transmembrane protease serine 9-like [Aricia agestis]